MNNNQLKKEKLHDSKQLYSCYDQMFPQLNSQSKSFNKISKNEKSGDLINYYDDQLDKDNHISQKPIFEDFDKNIKIGGNIVYFEQKKGHSQLNNKE